MLDRTTYIWPPSYSNILEWRQEQVLKMKDATFRKGAKLYYKTRPFEFIDHWCDTFDPRNVALGRSVRMPFLLFPRQCDLVQFLHGCLFESQNGLVEKSRDMGATWICVAYSVWLWLFHPGAAVGWGSRKADLVDSIGDMDSIFEKVRTLIMGLPKAFLPVGLRPKDHLMYMRVLNPENGATITGESGDDIGRGGRSLIYFKDESSHYAHPEMIEAALGDNTNVQIDISSVNGLGNVFHRKRESGMEWEPGITIPRGKLRVFIMDWRDHPGKSQAWYDERKKSAEDAGLLHKFYQEVDRNYSAAVDGVIIPADWVAASIDAHLKLNMPEMEEGKWIAGLDVADGGGDRNAMAKRKGVVLKYLNEWGERDTTQTAKRAVSACMDTLPIEVEYDCIGVGAGVKGETNRLKDANQMPKGIKFTPWSAAEKVLKPDDHVEPKDKNTPINKDFYGNLKAQAWWMLRRRFEKTFKAVTQGAEYPAHEMISLPSTLPRLRALQKELSQPTIDHHIGSMKLIVDKMPEGTRSPNLADAVVMCYWPIAGKSNYDETLSWVG